MRTLDKICEKRVKISQANCSGLRLCLLHRQGRQLLLQGWQLVHMHTSGLQAVAALVHVQQGARVWAQAEADVL